MLILLILTVFFYDANRRPEVQAASFASPAECIAALPVAKNKAQARSEVRVAKAVCFAVNAEGNKA